MANDRRGRRSPGKAFSGVRPKPAAPREPEVRRWPHPVDGAAAAETQEAEPALHYIRCALSYQNQLLADMKVLLEQLAADRAPKPEDAP